MTTYNISSNKTHEIDLSCPYKINLGVQKNYNYFSVYEFNFQTVTLLSFAPKHNNFNFEEYDKHVTRFL